MYFFFNDGSQLTNDFDCRKTNTKVITSNNHNRTKQCNDPIRIPSNLTCNLFNAREKSRNILLLSNWIQYNRLLGLFIQFWWFTGRTLLWRTWLLIKQYRQLFIQMWTPRNGIMSSRNRRRGLCFSSWWTVLKEGYFPGIRTFQKL